MGFLNFFHCWRVRLHATTDAIRSLTRIMDRAPNLRKNVSGAAILSFHILDSLLRKAYSIEGRFGVTELGAPMRCRP